MRHLADPMLLSPDPWYCAMVAPNKELEVQRRLRDQGFEDTFLPSFLVIDKHYHIKVRLLFGCYIFVRLPDPIYWPRVKRTIGVTRCLTYRPLGAMYDLPHATGSSAIERLRQLSKEMEVDDKTGTRLDKRDSGAPRLVIDAGCYVKIKSGPWKGYSGDRALIEWTDGDRAGLAMEIFGRTSTVEFYVKDLAPVKS